jgi:hypothetical protein
MVRYNNLEWLLKENKDILDEYHNPHVTFIRAGEHEQSDEEQLYRRFGINIVLCNSSATPSFIPSLQAIRETYRGLDYVRNDTMEIRVKLPQCRNEYIHIGQSVLIRWPDGNEVPDGLVLVKNIAVQRRDSVRAYANAAIAYQYQNTIVIWWSMEERNNANKAVLRHILKTTLGNISEETYPRQRPADFEKEEMYRLLTAMHNVRHEGLETQERQEEYNAQRALETYIRANRKVTEIQAQLEQAKSGNLKLEEKASQFVDYIKKAKKIERWSINGSSLTIGFKDLHIEYMKDVIALPKITATIDVRSGTFSAAATEDTTKTLPVHPHIWTEGRACLGNFTTIFPRIVAAVQLPQVCELLIQYFETYNNDSPVPGGNWIKWRIAAKNNINVIQVNTEQAVKSWEAHIKSLNGKKQ